MRVGQVLVAAALVVGACGTNAAPAATGAPAATTVSAPASASASTSVPAVKITVAWTAASGAQAGLWSAFEGGYFKEEGLDVDLVHIPSTSRSIAAMLAKEVQFGVADVQNLVEADAQGAEVKGVAAMVNNLVFSLMASPKIARGEDLKGKVIGITRVGSSTHTAALQALRVYKIDPKDVTFLQVLEVPAILAALQAGQVDAGTVSPPTNTRAKAAGFKELINLATDGPAYPSIVMAATSAYIAQNPDVTRRFVRGYSKGVQRFKTDKAFGMKAMNVYLKLTDQAVLEDTWVQFSKYLVGIPLVPSVGMETIIAEVAAGQPRAQGTKPERYLDPSFVNALIAEGFYKKLYP